MNIDDLDVAVFSLLFDGKSKRYTSTDIAKSILKPKDTWELRKFNTRLRYRLDMWVNASIIKKEKNKGKDYYFCDYEKIMSGDAMLRLTTSGGDTKDMPLGKVILILTKDRYHVISMLSE